MSTRGIGLQVTVHISQHSHHTEVMEEAENEIKKKDTSCELIHVDLGEAQARLSHQQKCKRPMTLRIVKSWRKLWLTKKLPLCIITGYLTHQRNVDASLGFGG